MNFLISHVTKLAPIKLTQRRLLSSETQVPPPGADSMQLPAAPLAPSSFSQRWQDPEHFINRQHCINVFVEDFGYMPLLRSSMRFDPHLFKDPVSKTRKKYRRLEMSPL